MVLCLGWFRGANSEILSNLHVINALIASGLAEVFKAPVPDSTDELVILEPLPRTGNEWLIEQQLAQLTASKPGLSMVYRDRYQQQGAQRALVFEFKVIDIKVSYHPDSGSKLTRFIQAVWFMKLQTATGAVLFLDTMTKSYEDQIDRNDVAQVENSNLSVTQGQLPAAGTFAKYVEPVVVSFVSGLIIYLFFIMRSN